MTPFHQSLPKVTRHPQASIAATTRTCDAQKHSTRSYTPTAAQEALQIRGKPKWHLPVPFGDVLPVPRLRCQHPAQEL